MYGGGAVIAAAAAKKKREREQREEEIMTKYSSDDLDGWEFKIVRSSTGSFKNTDKVQTLITEEAQSGWAMIEKFDNNRIRFKRKVQLRSQDSLAQVDPYRTQFGFGEGSLVTIILGVLLVVGGIFLMLFKFSG